MVLLIGILVAFLLVGGFGISTNIYSDFFGVSKKKNDFISLAIAVIFLIMLIYISV